MFFVYCLVTLYHILLSDPTQELIYYSEVIHLWVQKWDRKQVPSISHPQSTPVPRVGELSQNPEQGVFFSK